MNLTGKILIIDDEQVLRQSLARILQQAGMEVTTAENGEQGLAFLQASPYDLVYLDIRMPGLSGLQVLDRIHAAHPGIPVILFTAQPDLNSALEALRHGAVDYLLKPLKPVAIVEKTRFVLAGSAREKRRRFIQAQIEALQAELKRLDEPVTAPEAIPAPPPVERYLKCGPLSLDLHARRVSIDEHPLSLPPTSFDYLLVLARHAPRVVNYCTLVAEAQGFTAQPREAQELSKWHIHHIRQAIEPDPHNPVRLLNVRGTGYRLLTD